MSTHTSASDNDANLWIILQTIYYYFYLYINAFINTHFTRSIYSIYTFLYRYVVSSVIKKCRILINFFNSCYDSSVKSMRRCDTTRCGESIVVVVTSSMLCSTSGVILAIASTWHDESSHLILGRCTPGMLNALDNITVSQYVEPADNFYFLFLFF